jgi:hypothetical protein
VNGQRGKVGLLPATSATTSHGMSLPPNQPPPEKLKLTPEERRARCTDRTPAAIGEALGMPPAEATKLLRGHQWREGDVALLQAAAARLGVQVPGP